MKFNILNPSFIFRRAVFTKQSSTLIKLILVFLLWWRSTWLQHFLQHVELDPGLALVLGDGDVVGEVLVAQQGGEGVPVLVDGPLELAGVRVARPHVLGLEVLHLTEDIEPVPHDDDRI